MLSIKKLLGISALAALLAACNGGESSAPAAPSAPAVSQVQEHSHQDASQAMASGHYEGDGHDHSHDKDHSAMNALDWAGKYVGQLPCGSCDHILTTVELKQDGTYHYIADYQGGKQPLKVEKQGKFEWEDKGSIVELDLDNEEDLRFFVAEGHLQQLAKDQNQYQKDSHYNLKKQ